MKKRSLTLLLILALLASLMVIPTAAATDLSIPDESTFYQAFTVGSHRAISGSLPWMETDLMRRPYRNTFPSMTLPA